MQRQQAPHQEDQTERGDDDPKRQRPSAEEGTQQTAEGSSQDVKQDPLPSHMHTLVTSEKQRRRRNDFPWKLHTMLADVEKYHQTHVVSWAKDGSAFRVFKPDDFVARIMPHYFHQTQFRSFQRMLNLYEFSKVLTGPNRGCYHHPKFIRSNRELCLEMRIRKRTKPKEGAKMTGGKEKIVQKRSASGSKRAVASTASDQPPQQQLEQQRIMTMGGLVPRGNQEGMNMMAQLQRQRHSLDLLQTSSFHPVAATDIQSIMAQRMNAAVPFVNTSGTLASAPAPYGNADPASLHHHQALPPYKASRQTTLNDSEMIQGTTLGLQQPAGLNFLPASWNTTVFPTHYGNTPPIHGQDERIHPSSFGSELAGDYSARLKALEDPSVAPPLTANQHPLFGFSYPNSASSSHRQSHLLQSTTDLLLQQPQHQQQQQRDESEGQQQGDNDLSFDSPLHFDMEPNPLP